jgi:hypothetical protein
LEGVPAAEEFPIDPGEFLQLGQKLLVVLHALTALGDLGGLLELEGTHLTLGQTPAQVKEGAVLVALLAMTVGAATFKETLLKGGVQEVGGQLGGLKEPGFALPQSQSGEALEV